jgi:hypothetical protein
MAGLINNALTPPEDPLDPTTPLDPLGPEEFAATATPTLASVNQPTDTTAGQLDTLLSKDNPYITRARAKAAEYANSRGLLNSSMGAQAGEAAAIDAALPIASQDANTYSTQRLANQGASNQFGMQASAGDIASRAAVQHAQLETGLIGTRTEAEKALAAQQGEIQTSLQNLRGDQAKAVADIEANYKTLMQANASAATTFNSVMENIGKIMDDPNTTAEQKQAAVDNQVKLLNASLSVMGSIANLDLTSLLNFDDLKSVLPAPGTPGAPPSAPSPGAPGSVVGGGGATVQIPDGVGPGQSFQVREGGVTNQYIVNADGTVSFQGTYE